jgi:F-type H+-transporting ATPase subunit a
MHNPLEQFEVKPYLHLHILGHDVSFTNSSLFMILTLVSVYILFAYPSMKAKLIPNRFQAAAELIYEFIANMLQENIGSKGRIYIPFIFTLFIFTVLCNLLGLLPYSFAPTSQIIVTFTVAIIVFLTITLLGFVHNGLHFFSLFLPSGTPIWLAPLMIIIEFITYLSRPISLSIRLTANIVAGHVLLKILGSFILILGFTFGWVPMAFTILFTGFEFFVAILQAYIFSILACVYLNDVLNLDGH